MDNKKREVLLSKIKELDPNDEIVKINNLNNSIKYNEKIKQYRNITTLTDEEIVRAYFLVTLTKERGYSLDDYELEEEFLIGNKAKKTRVRVDIKLNRGKLNRELHTFMIFELKSPDAYEEDEVDDIKTQLFNVAKIIDPKAEELKWLAYCTVDVNEQGELEEIVRSINYQRFRTFEDWDEKGRISLKLIPKNYGTKIFAQYVRGGLKGYADLNKKEPEFEILELKPFVPKDRLEKIRKKLHDTLWAGGKKDYNKIFFNLVKIILAKIYDEKETENGQAYKFQIVYDEKNGIIQEDLAETKKNVIDLYNKAFFDKEYLGIDKNDLELLKQNEGAVDLIEFEDHEIAFILEQFEMYEITNTDYEFLGDFFESIIREEFKQNIGQYFTHKNIVNFILYGIELDKLSVELLEKEKRLPYIIDPSCGSGTFLIQSMKLIHNLVAERKRLLERKSDRLRDFLATNFPETKKQVWSQEYIYGDDFSALLGITTKVNMVLHGDGHIHIFIKDALSDFTNFEGKLVDKKTSVVYSKEVNEKFDVVVSNPPFSTSLDPITKRKLKDLYELSDKEISENLFIERYYQLLKEKGRLGVVLPESVFDTTDNLYIRLFIFKYFWIKAIISLPGGQKNGAFAPYTSTKTCLLLAQKKSLHEVKEWNQVWNEKERNYEDLLSHLNSLLDKDQIKKEEELEIIKLFRDIFKENFEEEDKEKEFSVVRDKYNEMLKEKRLKEWWVFTEVSRYLVNRYPTKSSYLVFHAEEIGYKRTKRGERKRPNYLYSSEIEDGREKIVIKSNPVTILDVIRGKVKWD